MSLTETDVKLLRESWKELAKLGLQEVGLAILHRLITTVPEVAPLFYKVVPDNFEATIENMRAEEKIRSHAFRVGTSISKLIKNLENPDEFKNMLVNLGQSHKQHKVDPKYFKDMGSVLLHVISTALEVELTSEMMQSWTKAYGAIHEGIVASMA